MRDLAEANTDAQRTTPCVFKASERVTRLAATKPGFDIFAVQFNHASAIALCVFVSNDRFDNDRFACDKYQSRTCLASDMQQHD